MVADGSNDHRPEAPPDHSRGLGDALARVPDLPPPTGIEYAGRLELSMIEAPFIQAGRSARQSAMGVGEFIERCGTDPSSAAVFDVFRAAAEQSGYNRLALVPVSQPAHQALGLPDVAPVVSTNVPEAWIEHYFGSGYQLLDPVLLRTPHQDQPLLWEDLLVGGTLTPRQRRVLTESRDAGLYNGASIPLHGPRGETWVISLATEDTAAPAAGHLDHLHALAMQFLVAYTRALRPQGDSFGAARLTDRERECLTWTARGKSAWSIGKILDVSEHTVNFHLKRCMSKLGTANRMQAVVSALRLGLILP